PGERVGDVVRARLGVHAREQPELALVARERCAMKLALCQVSVFGLEQRDQLCVVRANELDQRRLERTSPRLDAQPLPVARELATSGAKKCQKLGGCLQS